MIAVGTVVNDLLVVAFDSENSVWVCECLLHDDSPRARAQGNPHTCLQSTAALEAGAQCKTCLALKAREADWIADARRQQLALEGGN